MTETEIGADEQELREIEERLYQLTEKWTRETLNAKRDGAVYRTADFDCGMLAAVRRVLDAFLGGTGDRDAWLIQRDDARRNDRLTFALKNSEKSS